MILATVNKLKQVLWINYVGQILPEDLQRGREDLKVLLGDLRPGFRLMVNISHLDSMGLDCRAELGLTMDLMSHSGVARVVRIVPDPSKDLGFNIMAVFHYRNHPQLVTCTNLTDALEKLLG